jgi:hypothetical protein
VTHLLGMQRLKQRASERPSNPISFQAPKKNAGPLVH